MTPDPVLDNADPTVVAHGAAIEHLLRCWCRETGVVRPKGDTLTIDFASSGVRLRANVRHWSATGWHRFSEVRLNGDQPADLATVAALLAREGAGAPDFGAGSQDQAALVSRVLESSRRVAEHVAHSRAEPAPPPDVTPFLEAEQALLLGHPLHPTPKSRDALSDAEAREFSPELRGRFQPYWFAADPSIVSSDSAIEQGAEQVLSGFAGDEAVAAAPEGMVLVPAHPWQARDLVRRPGLRTLLDRGVLCELGPSGVPWYPTSSVRTVCRPDASMMLKFSLGLRITNSRRENLRKELLRGVEVHRLLEAGLGAELRQAYPGFDVVRDPAWLAVDLPGDPPDSGLDVVLRQHSFTVTDRAMCVAGLVAEQPGIGPSRLGALVSALGGGSNETERSVCAEWLRRYVRAVVEPVLWLYARHGVALEAHQQNTLVVLDDDGWPVGGRYRDNQGYYFAASRIEQLRRWQPGVGEASDTTVPDEVADERLGYYLGINNLLGLVGAFGSQSLADERGLLGVLRAELRRIHNQLSGKPDALTALLDSPTLRCKANLLTRLHGMDELVGPVSSQSVYVTIPNPLVRA